MAGLGMGSQKPGVTPPGLPLGANFWSAGGWWDFIGLAGANGSPVTSTIASASGSNVLTPNASPLIDDVAEYGNRGLSVVDSGVNGTRQYLTCSALAALFTGSGTSPWTVVQRFRQTKRAEMPLWTAHAAAGTVAFGARSVAEVACLRKTSTVGGTVTATGTKNIGYDDHTYVWTYDPSGPTWSQYIDGALDSLSNGLDLNSISVSTFAILASVSSIDFEGATGRTQLFAASNQLAQAADVASIYAYTNAQNFVLAPTDPLTPKMLWVGASVLNGASDLVTVAGYRAQGSQFVIDNRLSVLCVGAQQGNISNRGTPSTSGAGATAITAQVTANLDARTAIVVFDLGDEEIDLGQTAAQVATAITTAIANIRTACYAVNPQMKLATFTVIPLFEPALNSVCQQVNAALPGIWAASNAAFPSNPPLRTRDLNTDIGGPSYVQANYSAIGNDHPNNTGYNKCQVLQATDGLGNTLASDLQAVSPT